MAEDRDEPFLLPDAEGGDEFLDVPRILPVLPVRDAVVFPGVTAPLAVGREGSISALEEAGEGGFLLIGTQRDPATEHPEIEDLHPVGCIARVVKVMGIRGEGGKHAVVVGVVRARLGEAAPTEGPALRIAIKPLIDDASESAERDVAWHRVVELAQTMIDLRDDLPEEWKVFVANLPSPGLLSDLVASTLPASVEEKVALLAEASVTARLEAAAAQLEREITIAEAQRALSAETDDEDPRRRERLLRRRMREIQAELGEVDSASGEVDDLREKIEAQDMPEEAAAHADRELRRLAALPQHAPDRHLLRTYLEWLADLPWSHATEDKLDLAEARRVLDEDHHGLEKVKERILEFLAVRKLAPEASSPILCFVGPPGVGKTSLGRSIARAMGRKFARAALGGVRDEAEIRGHRRTYVGAMPGRILQNLRRAGTRNPVFLLDEVDKLGADFRGDPSSALLEVLDPEQNKTFSDHYLEIPFDLSSVLFITTANTLSTVPPALLDRMEVIELPGYTDRDKLAIARSHLLKKQLEGHGLTEARAQVADDALRLLVDEYTREAGVRNLDRQLATLIRKAAARIATDRPSEGDPPLLVDEKFLRDSLGAPPHLPETAERTKIPGVVVGLAATSHGGDILFIEATAMPGGESLRLRLTGQLGDVMRESAEAAVSWVRANADALGCRHEVLNGGEIHLHVPAGAVPKDGPSAGVTLATAVVSVLSGRRARGDVAMTGEISLRGRVLPVGGIKDKILAAARAGVRTVVMPRRNEKDLVDVPEDVRDELSIVLVDTVDEALEVALEPAQD
ncbi:MAG: endopeptidase La [Deltaproteobacteria bacterium]|nr:endopeptidase La [Deltaproteobacteria bacterium]MBW2447274.1 endopeptidase La [Deltaproteobacteria bacterium]